MFSATNVEICQLTLRAQRMSERALAEHALRQLESTDVPPPGNPAEVLLIRQLTGPAPPTGDSASAAAKRRRWERDLADRLARHRALAVRPAEGASSADAEAVLFDDETDLLACWCIDWLEQRHLHLWWWQVLTKRGLRKLEDAFRSSPHATASLLSQLQSRGRAIDIVKALDTATAASVVDSCLTAFGAQALLPPLRAALRAHPHSSSRWNDDPWLREVIECVSNYLRPHLFLTQDLGVDRTLLLGLGLALRHEPRRVRWLAACAPSPGARVSLSSERNMGAETLLAVAQKERTIPSPLVVPTPRANPETTEAASEDGSSSAHLATQHHRPRPLPPLAPFPPEDALATPATSRSVVPAREAAGKANRPTPPADQLPPLGVFADTERLGTKWGGVLYLIHVGRDFEPNDPCSCRTSAWALLELLARGLLCEGEHDPALADPVFRALQRLDERESGLPGDELPEVVALEPHNHFGDEPFRLAEAHIDNLARQGLGVAAIEWLKLELPAIADRLSSALKLRTRRFSAIAEVLLRVPGTIHITPTHVDLRAPLRAISLPVRRAGLDQDPGWCADFGRVIHFHFEDAS